MGTSDPSDPTIGRQQMDELMASMLVPRRHSLDRDDRLRHLFEVFPPAETMYKVFTDPTGETEAIIQGKDILQLIEVAALALRAQRATADHSHKTLNWAMDMAAAQQAELNVHRRKLTPKQLGRLLRETDFGKQLVATKRELGETRENLERAVADLVKTTLALQEAQKEVDQRYFAMDWLARGFADIEITEDGSLKMSLTPLGMKAIKDTKEERERSRSNGQ